MKVRPVTDHALLRYIERVAGVDLDALCEAIVTPEVRAAITAKARTYRTPEATYVIKGGQIVTILGPGMKPHHKANRPEIVWEAAQ